MPELAVGTAAGSRLAVPVGRYRWLVCGLLFVITVNNYMDRQMLSIAAPAIAAEYGFSNSEIATPSPTRSCLLTRWDSCSRGPWSTASARARE